MYHEVEFACDLSIVAWKSYKSGNSERAKALYVRALTILQRSAVKTGAEQAAVLNRLGLIVEANREYSDAAQYYSRACEILESVEPSPRIWRLKVRALYHLGRIRRMQGGWAEAERLLQDALHVAEQNLDTKDIEVAYAANQLAMLLRHKRDFQQARALYYRGLRILEKKFGPDHPRVASFFRNLSELEYAAGRPDKGEPFARRAILIRMKLLGPEHPDVAKDLATLGCLLKAQKKFQEAEKLYTRALMIIQNSYGEEHYETSVHLSNVASFYVAKGEDANAEWLYWQALTVKERSLGPDHPDCALTMMKLSELYKRQHRYDEADLLCRKALEIMEKILEPDHPHLIESRKYCEELAALLDVSAAS